jgi:hypothetical protein
MILVAAILAAIGLTPAQQPGAVRIGMTANEVRKILGEPEHISRQILFRRHFEQWQFAKPVRIIEFHGVRGEEARATRID